MNPPSQQSQSSDENSNVLNKTSSSSPSFQLRTFPYQSQTKQTEIEQINNLKSLQSALPFLFKDNQTIMNDFEYNSEYTKISQDIIQHNSTQYLQGKLNIIDKLINVHSNINITPQQDYSKITKIKLTIPKNFGMMNDIGFHLPNLIELDLEGSSFESINEIGTSFSKLKKLNVSKCGLRDLSGIFCFEHLEELNASYNSITDLIDLEMCNELKLIRLDYNQIEEEDNLYFLNVCDKLERVYIRNTPLSMKFINKEINITNIFTHPVQIIYN